MIEMMKMKERKNIKNSIKYFYLVKRVDILKMKMKKKKKSKPKKVEPVDNELEDSDKDMSRASGLKIDYKKKYEEMVKLQIKESNSKDSKEIKETKEIKEVKEAETNKFARMF